MKRMSSQETMEAFGEFAQKAERIVKPTLSKAKRWFFCILGVFIVLVGLLISLVSTGAMGKVIGLGILAFGLYIALSRFLPYKVGKIAAGLLFVVIGVAFAFIGYHSYQLGKQSKDWPVAKGSVIQSKIEKRTETTGSGSNRRKVVRSYAVVKYTYAVGNRDYQSSRIAFGQSKNAHEIVVRYPKGKSIQVYYDPQKPDQAVLEPGADPTFSIVFIGIGVVLALMGLAVAARYRKMTKVLSQA